MYARFLKSIQENKKLLTNMAIGVIVTGSALCYPRKKPTESKKELRFFDNKSTKPTEQRPVKPPVTLTKKKPEKFMMPVSRR